MKILSQNEQHTLHHRYKQNDLFRQWLPILSKLSRSYDEADPYTLWYKAEQIIVRLRNEQTYREYEIPPIYNALIDDCLVFDEIPRTKKQAQHTAATVMCILLTMLMNAVDKSHEEESFANEPMCIAILDIFVNDSYFQKVMDVFFGRRIGYDGQKVVITPNDPMQGKTLFEGMDNVAQDEINQLVGCVISHTQALKAYFKDNWSQWEPLWRDICADTQLVFLLKNKKPRTTDWGINQKMVFNVIGIFKSITKIETPDKTLSDVLSKANRRTYISNHANYGTTDCVFTREQHELIERLIKNCFCHEQKTN